MSGESTIRSAADEKAFYDDMWTRYAHLDAASPAGFHRRRLLLSLVSKYAPAAKRVLDVGCGEGELLRDLGKRLPGASFHGADLSEQSLVITRRINPTFDLFELDISDDNMPGVHPDRVGAYDLVICSEVVEHIPNHTAATKNLARLLAPGGVLIATVPGGKMSRFDVAIGHQRHYRPETLADLLKNAGLRIERAFAWGFPFQNIYRIAVRAASKVAMPEGGQPTPSPSDETQGALSRALSAGYVAFGRLMRPLFYLNASWGGEQVIVVARAPR